MSEDIKAQALKFKENGNKKFSEGNYNGAIELFSKAIELDPNEALYLSNRSACYAKLKNYQKALEDSEKAIEIKPTWAKAYSRKGAALYGLNRLKESADAYRKAVEINPDNSTMKILKDIEEEIERAELCFPSDLLKLCAQSSCAKYLGDPSFVNALKDIQYNPKNITKYTNNEKVMEFVLQTMVQQSPEKTEEDVSSREKEQEKPKSEPEPAKETEPELTEEEKSKKNKREESDKEKVLGNNAYKKKDFETALTHYAKAYEIDDTNVAVLTNKAAVLFEMGNYDDTIKVCEEAVEHGREVRADFKLIARAFHRIGNAYRQKGDLENAIKYYNKSLAEHRTPQVLEILRKVEKEKAEAAKLAYHDEAKADEARNQGNALFKEGKYSEAVKFYTEAIKRNENDPRNWNNRATCYIKLMAISEAEKDADECIKRDPNFLKAYIRKAQVYLAKRENSKAIDMLNFVKEKDVDNKHSVEIQQQMMKCYAGISENQNNENTEEVLRRAQDNPEVAAILSDPIMRSILEQMQTDPAAARDHLKNPTVAAKIRTLVDAGIIRLSR